MSINDASNNARRYGTANDSMSVEEFAKASHNTRLSMNDILIPNLKEMCDRLEGKDKCLICETIHALENLKNESNNGSGSLWMILIFLICFGFDSDFSKIDLGILAKVLDGTMNEKKEKREKTDDISTACCCCGGPVLENYNPTKEETK